MPKLANQKFRQIAKPFAYIQPCLIFGQSLLSNIDIKPGFCKAQIAKPESGQKLCIVKKVMLS